MGGGLRLKRWGKRRSILRGVPMPAHLCTHVLERNGSLNARVSTGGLARATKITSGVVAGMARE